MRLRAFAAAAAAMAGLAGAAAAEDAYIRIEAKRGAAAEAALAGWKAKFPDVVTFPLANGMTAIALGPAEPAAAAARMAGLKAAGEIPADSFLAAEGGARALAVPVAEDGAAAPDEAADATAADETAGAEATPDRFQPGMASTAGVLGLGGAADPAAEVAGEAGESEAPESEAAAPEAAAVAQHIQLQATASEATAQTLLGEWRARFPEAGLWRLPNGWYAIALAAQPPAEAEARRQALIRDGSIPADAYLTGAGAMGSVIEAPGAAGAGPAEAEATVPAPATSESGDAADAAAQAAGEDAPAPGGPTNSADEISAGSDAEAAPDRGPAKATGMAEGDAEDSRPAPDDTPAADRADEETGATAADTGAETTTPPPAGTTASGEAAPPAPAAEAASEPQTPPVPAVMPPIEEVQRALRWAGYYDGEIDGDAGPATKAAIDREIAAVSPGATPAEAMVALLARREAWRRDMGLTPLHDPATGITLEAPMARLAFDRVEHGLSIYGPRDGSGAALILVARPGDRAAMAELGGFVTALGWVPNPERREGRNSLGLSGQNATHHGEAELRLVDGTVQGFVLVWPAADADNARRLAAEAAESLTRVPPPEPEPEPPADTAGTGDAVPAPALAAD